ncbi:4'-phosphopantetheinyl transferase superfamily protein [Ramlibacter sp. AW1]|uniref:4'-phosphopantetheinyl transferase superfamily protein n=1 Tax=Ramlibacter aurantiacus TaxID=2801330 RepID=A0A936ZHZ1_9BURK|nr:4'-phosphopantetheinyl transferase superfamily protein [Ramlibacter aurantiacus]MBL0420568.1 4'-phosphopantetheinyl transferase superfamily protein [Ramlibacter aurantiacus]
MELWHVPLRITADTADRVQACLDATERGRAARFRRPADRLAYIAAHVALRSLLARKLGRQPHELRFVGGAEGKPALAPPHDALEFNLSHSAGFGLVGLAESRPVGVDIEAWDVGAVAVQGEDSLDAVLSPAEREAIAACDPASRPLARLRCWVRKEALLKAAGCGLSDEVRQVSVDVGAEARLLASTHARLRQGDWSVRAFEQAGSWSAAVATGGAMPPVTIHHWTWSA